VLAPSRREQKYSKTTRKKIIQTSRFALWMYKKISSLSRSCIWGAQQN